ncbi:MAG: DNA-formamidopyrimidine glycosylase [Firmicutes bacterium]|nr:DNA-formamidopyrimidine glycosylase [Bacillota bacterium]
MPELPEVETVKRTLEKKIVDRVITEVEVALPKIVQGLSPMEFSERLVGQKILGIDRRGKYLLTSLSNGQTLVTHLKMTGRWLYTAADVPQTKHTHVVFTLDNGHQLRFQDLRQFGYMLLVPRGELHQVPGLNELGVEPLGDEFTREYLAEITGPRKTKIKQLLLDQTLIAGIGNIYADEILFTAGLHPERVSNSLSPAEINRLYAAIRQVLAAGVEHRGTSVSDYVDGEGRPGEYQHYLQVYAREGQACPRCGQVIHRLKVGGRSSYHCPNCQN